MELAGTLAGPDAVDDSAGIPGAERPVDGSDAEPAGGADLRAMAPRHQRRLILEELRAGRSDTEIGARFALSQWQVRNLRYRLGLKKDRGGHVAMRSGAASTLERQFVEAAQRVAGQGDAAARRSRRLPRIPEGDGAERMAVRLAGRFSGAEAGGRLSALGGLLAASEGEYEVRLALQQLGEGPGR